MPGRSKSVLERTKNRKEVSRTNMMKEVAKKTGFYFDDVKTVINEYGRQIESGFNDLSRIQISENIFIYCDHLPGRKIKLIRLDSTDGQVSEMKVDFVLTPRIRLLKPFRFKLRQVVAERIKRTGLPMAKEKMENYND